MAKRKTQPPRKTRAPRKPKMPKAKQKAVEATTYRHGDAKRKNIPAAAMEAEGQLPKIRRIRYAYSPHLDPVLRFDPTGRADKVVAIVEKACRGERLDKSEQEILRAVGQNWEQPWLEWAGKQEEHSRGHFAVDPVALHIHERISAQAILRNAMREDAQRSLFAAPEQTYAEALQFYKHDVDWANRLILGDSLQVMSSLAQRENLAGKVQMIYIDPPYGIKFGSNFQPEVGRREVKDGRDEDLTREAETVKAYRDTWHLGISSYLSYLRERFAAARVLLTSEGSIFVQISDDHIHRVRALLDEVFGDPNFVSQITVKKTGGFASSQLLTTQDYLLWYAKDRSKIKYHPLYSDKSNDAADDGHYQRSSEGSLFTLSDLTGQNNNVASCLFRPTIDGRTFALPNTRQWKTTAPGLHRLREADRVVISGNSIRYKRWLSDFTGASITDAWHDIGGSVQSRNDPKVYVVQTGASVIARCLHLTTDPGDLVLDPTCGSGTTAYVSEQWGRRWITIDTSRVALAIARQRILTTTFDHYATRGGRGHGELSCENPGTGFKYRRTSKVTLGSITTNQNLDPVFARHKPLLDESLESANRALVAVPASLRDRLRLKLAAKEKAEGKTSVTDADRRRWLLPPNNRDPKEKWTVDSAFAGWYDWEVPFDTDPDWPKPLKDAVLAYRAAWRAKMDEVNKCIADNAEQEELVDQPEVVMGVVRVSGPFTVEGVIPEELSLGEDGYFDPTPNEFESDSGGLAGDPQNVSAYLSRMVAHLRSDGLTFLNNKRKRFDQLDAIFEDGSGSFLHAEGTWEGEAGSLVAVTVGPQYGPVTALQVEEAIRAAKRYTDLVIAGFSFDAETYAIAEQQQHPKLRIHLAQIRPDLNESMDGLLKNTPNSQLFTVFGQPDIDVKHIKEGWVCTLKGVDIYDPTKNALFSSGADKVAAWFLDSDYDGRCFCATQAFFPNRDAWEKIAKALGDQGNADAFEAFKGTTSLPFDKGTYGRIAVKVIDPRGNDVMAIRKLS